MRTTDAGKALEVVRINNDLDSLAAVIARAGEAPEVVLALGAPSSHRCRRPLEEVPRRKGTVRTRESSTEALTAAVASAS